MLTHPERNAARIQDKTTSSTCTKTSRTAYNHAAIFSGKQNLFAFQSAIAGSFNSFFKVLFMFPSWYLFAIGLNNILTFAWNLPPTLHSSPKKRDSESTRRAQRAANDRRDSRPHWCLFSKKLACAPLLAMRSEITFQSQSHELRFSSWALPCSFAITEGIQFGCFSSAYLYA